MKKKLILIFVLTILAALPLAAQAQNPDAITVAVENLQYVDMGETFVTQMEAGVLVRTTGIRGTAVLACNGDAACEAAGLEGAAVGVQQDLGIVIDVIGAGVVGRSRVDVILLNQGGNGQPGPLHFIGGIEGTAFKGTDEELQAFMSFTGASGGGNTLALDLTGILIAGNGGPQWQSMAGGGTLSLFGIFPN